MSFHASTCTCVRCLCVASAAAWANSKTRRPATPDVIAGVLLSELKPTAALGVLVRVIRYVKLARDAEKALEITKTKPALRLIVGGKTEAELVKEWEDVIP